MPRFNCNVKGDYWICFSTIVDSFVTKIMHIDDYEKWRQEQYGINCGSVTEANLMNFDKAVREMKKVHNLSDEEVKEELEKLGCDYIE